MRKPAAGGRGSNQYQTKGSPQPSARLSVHGIQVSLDSEAVAWAFDQYADPEEVLATANGPVRVAGHPDPKIRILAAQDPRCPPEVLGALADDTAYQVRHAVAAHRRTPPPTLERMAVGRPNQPVAVTLLGNPSSPATVFHELLSVPGVEVLTNRTAIGFRLAGANPNCPDVFLEGLARSRREEVRRAVARNPSCPPITLRALTRDPSVLVQLRAWGNPSLPIADIEFAAADRHNRLPRSIVADNPRLPDARCPDSAREFPKSLAAYRWARSGDCTPDDLAWLAEAGGKRTRAAVAANPMTPDVALEGMAFDMSTKHGGFKKAVAIALARNPRTPLAALQRMPTGNSMFKALVDQRVAAAR